MTMLHETWTLTNFMYDNTPVFMPNERIVTLVPMSRFPASMDRVIADNESSGSPLASSRITVIANSQSYST